MDLIKKMFANAGLPTTGGIFAPKVKATATLDVQPQETEYMAQFPDPSDVQQMKDNAPPASEMGEAPVTWEAEYTDTFGGEANYSWVERKRFTLPERATQADIVKAAKAAVGLTGVKCDTESLGEGYRVRPRGTATVLFINYVEG